MRLICQVLMISICTATAFGTAQNDNSLNKTEKFKELREEKWLNDFIGWFYLSTFKESTLFSLPSYEVYGIHSIDSPNILDKFMNRILQELNKIKPNTKLSGLSAVLAQQILNELETMKSKLTL